MKDEKEKIVIIKLTLEWDNLKLDFETNEKRLRRICKKWNSEKLLSDERKST